MKRSVLGNERWLSAFCKDRHVVSGAPREVQWIVGIDTNDRSLRFCNYSNKRDIRVAVMLHISVCESKYALGGNESTTGTYGAVRKVTNVMYRRLTRQMTIRVCRGAGSGIRTMCRPLQTLRSLRGS